MFPDSKNNPGGIGAASVGQTVFPDDLSFNAPQIPLLRGAFLTSFHRSVLSTILSRASQPLGRGVLPVLRGGRRSGKCSMSRELLQDGQWPTRNGRGTGPHASQEMAELGGDGVCLRFLRDAQPPVTAASSAALTPAPRRELPGRGRGQCPLRSGAEQVQPDVRAREPPGATLDGDCGQVGSVP